MMQDSMGRPINIGDFVTRGKGDLAKVVAFTPKCVRIETRSVGVWSPLYEQPAIERGTYTYAHQPHLVTVLPRDRYLEDRWALCLRAEDTQNLTANDVEQLVRQEPPALWEELRTAAYKALPHLTGGNP